VTGSPEFSLSEAGREQLQTLTMLSAVGWRYVTRAEADRQRGHRRTAVLLEDILRTQLRSLNRIRWNGRNHPFSEGNIETAVERLRDVRFDGLLRTNERQTDLLQLGIALPQTVDGQPREWPFRYVDWSDARANAFHMTSEFPVDWPEGAAIRPDIVLFVNGAPFAVIEVKRSQEKVEQGISQQLRNQKPSLCRPERLLDLSRRFSLFDGPVKKIARHQQMFAVKDLLRRIETRDARGRREGGVVWHTQGSGKSLTMVMLAKAVAFAVPTARIVLVTDRTDLDDQIEKTFAATGLSSERAKTGEHLLELIEAKTPVITTLIHKFKAALNKRKATDPSTDIFVLVDESHRSQYGDLQSMHARMREVFPNACLIGFTGTPIAKKERNTFLKFGRLVDPVYSMRDAIEDRTVVPLLYEGRHVEEDLDEAAVDAWFERVTRGLSDAQRADLKRKMSRPRVLMGVSARLRCIAFDVSRHFSENFWSERLKGQLVAPSKRDAIALKKLLDDFGEVTSEVVISAPDEREGEKDIDEETDDEVVKFWRRMMDRYGGEDAYNRQIVEAFKGSGDPDILIVVDKLLTGFDAPRNTVLYLARPLREHGLLQAIARVNRVFDEEAAPDKPFGFIIDYCGVLKHLGEALTANDALANFDEGDLNKTISSIADEARRLPEKHAALLDLFAGVSNTFDEEAYARTLADEALRAEFYRALSAFSRTLTVAVASRTFVEETPPERLARWRSDEKRFIALRAHVRTRYARTAGGKSVPRAHPGAAGSA
jgi:type I restriction enzyme R subunit